MKVDDLKELYVDELRDLYSAELQLVAALPKIAEATTAPELKTAIEDHLGQTKGQIKRLDKIFQELGESSGGETCDAMKGLLKEGSKLIETVAQGPVRDAALIGAAQKVEHYEMAGYGTARTFAQLLGHENHVDLLQETLDEEAGANDMLTEIAEQIVNNQAAKKGSTSAVVAGRSGR